MKVISKIIALAALLVSSGLAAQPNTATQKLVSEYSRKEPLRSGIFGVLAVRGADTLAQYNRRLKLIPASNVKLITTGLALTRLGPDWKFSTTLAHNGYVADGVLHGDLYIVGGGDPTIASESSCADSLALTFSRWKSILDENGIKAIKGRVIGDPRFFKRPYEEMSWQAEDLGYDYGAGPSGLNFFENSQNFSVTSGAVGKAPVITPLYPDTPWMDYVNMSVTGEKGTANTLYYVNTQFGPFGEFHGSIPAGRKGYKFECSNFFGAYTCAYFFCNYLICNGVTVENGFADVSPYGLVRSDLLFSSIGSAATPVSALRTLGSSKSPELWRIVKDTNYDSDNFYAETFFDMLSVNLYGSADRDSSALAVKELLGRLGLRTENACRLVDGSGLSRKNFVSPEFFVRFLKKMYAGPVRDFYLESLPSPGTKSTLQYRMGKAPDSIKSRIKMKSGSMGGVLCFSGYILSPDGDRSKTIVFSILANNFTAPSYAVGSILDEIIVSLALEP